MSAKTRADLDALRERDGGAREVVAEWTRPDLSDTVYGTASRISERVAALSRPEGPHKYDRGGIHREVSDCGACAELHTLRRVLPVIDRLEKANAALASLSSALEPTGDHHQLPDGYCLDCGGGCLRGLAEENAEAIRRASFAGPSPFVTKGGE